METFFKWLYLHVLITFQLDTSAVPKITDRQTENKVIIAQAKAGNDQKKEPAFKELKKYHEHTSSRYVKYIQGKDWTHFYLHQ